MNKFTMFIIVAFAMSAPAFADGDAAAGKEKSTTCAACHGPTGISINELWPNIAGQQAAYMVKQLKAFRDGDRSDPNMDAMVAQLTDQDIEDLAAFYASMGCD